MNTGDCHEKTRASKGRFLSRFELVSTSNRPDILVQFNETLTVNESRIDWLTVPMLNCGLTTTSNASLVNYSCVRDTFGLSVYSTTIADTVFTSASTTNVRRAKPLLSEARHRFALGSTESFYRLVHNHACESFLCHSHDGHCDESLDCSTNRRSLHVPGRFVWCQLQYFIEHL